MVRTFALSLMAACAVVIGAAHAEDEVLIIEQDYNIVQSDKDGPEAKDIRQYIYVSKDFVCIDDAAGRDGKITESIMIDFKKRLIVNLDHANKKKVEENFDDRRKRIDGRKRDRQRDLDDQPEGPQKDKMIRLYRALLDDKRIYKLTHEGLEASTLMGVTCNPVKITSVGEPDFIPMEAQLHPELKLPYDNVEVLYLLQIIGKRLAEYLRENREVFKYIPMELHLELAAGGRLDTKVVSVKKLDRSKMPQDLRGALGSPFEIPNYEEVKKRPTRSSTNDRPD